MKCSASCKLARHSGIALNLGVSLVFKTIQTEGIAELSYLLGDDDEGVGAIFDPRADVEIYVEMARETGLAITHIFETHIHADLVSGSRELSARLNRQRFIPVEKAALNTALDLKR